MDRMLYVAMSGAKQTMLAQAVNTNNLANASTSGFRADLATFHSVPIYGPGQQSRTYAVAEQPGIDASEGALLTTGRELDMAVKGQGWIAVQAPDGSEAYTRAGDLRISATGQLTNGAGHAVLGNGGPIAVPAFEKLEIGADGTISIRPVGQSATTLAIVDRVKLVKPPVDQMYKGDDGLMRLKDNATLPPDASIQVVSGVLESSNVNAVESMVNMISLSRQFEMQIKLMKTAEDNDSAASQIMRLG